MNDCPIGRGTTRGYDHYGCRCHPCTNAKRVAMQMWRRNQPPREAEPVDDIAVERALNGTYPGQLLTYKERAAAVALGERRGLSHLEIARRMQLSDRTVVRYAAKLRSAA